MLVSVQLDGGPDPVTAAVRLTTHLNSQTWSAGPNNPVPSADVAARTVMAGDSAHHVVDPDSLLGLNPIHANELSEALVSAAQREATGWLLVLPRPGDLGGLRGPVTTNSAALESGAAVVARTAGVAWIPLVIGSGVQWLIHPAAPPTVLPDPSEAERAFNEALVAATRALGDLDVAGGDRPELSHSPRLPQPYDARRQRSLDRAWRLHQIVTIALSDEGGALSSYEMAVRRQQLTALLAPAAQVISAACSAGPRPH